MGCRDCNMARWGRHSCLPALTRADRNVRATLGHHLRWSAILSPPVDTRRQPPAGAAVLGLEDEDENLPAASPPSALSLHRTAVSGETGAACAKADASPERARYTSPGQRPGEWNEKQTSPEGAAYSFGYSGPPYYVVGWVFSHRMYLPRFPRASP